MSSGFTRQGRIEMKSNSQIDLQHPTPRVRRRVISAISSANRIVDWVLGISHQDVLNAGETHHRLQSPAQELRKTANLMRSEALDPETGRLDYQKLTLSSTYSRFREFTQTLPQCTIEEIGVREDLIAFWINIYNVLILDAIIQYDVRDSLLRDPGFFRRAAYTIGGYRFSADDIEHGILRGNRRHPYLPFPPFDHGDPRLKLQITGSDPRIHFALVCGANSCPPIAFYEGNRLEQQLELAAASFINGGGVQLDPMTQTIRLSQIFRWYQLDFGGREAVLRFIRQRTTDSEIGRFLDSESPRIKYQKYDWSVNALS
jgi:hypothetical protein